MCLCLGYSTDTERVVRWDGVSNNLKKGVGEVVVEKEVVRVREVLT